MSQRYRDLDDPETLRLFLSRVPAGLYITSEEGEILDVNQGFLDLLKLESKDELEQLSAEDVLVDPERRERELELLADAGVVREFELQLRLVDGTERTVLDTCYRVRDPSTGEILFHGILVDITEHKRLEERLRELSIRDPLTGCFNRRRLHSEARKLEEQAGTWGTVVIDVDNFKEYNDRYGHEEGDAVLQRVSRFLFRLTRSEDAVFRLGGDEFLVLLTGDAAEATEEVARQIRTGKREPAPVPVSLGWAVRKGEEGVESTISRADQQLLAVRQRERAGTRRSE
ncbi:MAG: sensor domain-containing diguanylate cyclase [Thermoanaerobaculia bacterium]|nr:sensor domain-containing diguanylate cyclase [Thermoanaerobaculia bacterium]